MRKIACVNIPGKGRGIVATSAIAAGEVVERSPVLPLSLADSEVPGLSEYAMAWEENLDEGDPAKACCIGLGYLVIYNHANPPNVKLMHHYESHEISVVAMRDIAAGEELCYDYVVPLWFQAA